MSLAGRRQLRVLKDETAALQHEVERYIRILDPSATLVEYRRFLRTMAGFYGPLERTLERATELAKSGYLQRERSKSHLLVRDLRVLGVRAWRACEALASPRSLPQSIGAVFVAETLMLGGRAILSKLPPAIASVKGAATAFLEGYGDATSERWRSFGTILEHGLPTAAAERAAVEGAHETFRKAIEWLALHERCAAAPPPTERA